MSMEDQIREEAHRRRAPLRAAANDLELAIAAPVGTAVWRDRVRESLARMQVALKQHIQLTEGPDGLYAQLQNSAPRLSNLIRLLTEEHLTIREDINRTLASLEELPENLDDECCENVRESSMALMGRVARHRQKGADLLWRAYSVDIGGE